MHQHKNGHEKLKYYIIITSRQIIIIIIEIHLIKKTIKMDYNSNERNYNTIPINKRLFITVLTFIKIIHLWRFITYIISALSTIYIYFYFSFFAESTAIHCEITFSTRETWYFLKFRQKMRYPSIYLLKFEAAAICFITADIWWLKFSLYRQLWKV